MKFIQTAVNYVKESIAELKKVVWPTKEQTTKHTILVVSISLLVALFLGFVDYALTYGVENFIIQ